MGVRALRMTVLKSAEVLPAARRPGFAKRLQAETRRRHGRRLAGAKVLELIEVANVHGHVHGLF
jgi:hypothetical protein